MNQNPPETPTRIPPDINNNAMQLTIPTVFLDKAAKAKAAAKQSKAQDFLHKKQDVKESIANIIAILKIINAEMQYEQDQETFTVLIQQKEVFEKILSQKQTEEKNSLRTIKNEIISQLQNQIKKIEKYMKNKIKIKKKKINNNKKKNKNKRFFKKANIYQSLISTANKSFTSLSIVLTTMSDFSADFLLQKKTI